MKKVHLKTNQQHSKMQEAPHNHHHAFSWKHLKDHPICLATIVYGILVVIAEIVILSFVTDMNLHDLLSYEGAIQAVHLFGILILAIVNYWWIHRISGHADTPMQATKKFFSVSFVILLAHIVLLHVVPRWIGFELHQHGGHGEHTHTLHKNSEMIEYITLAGVIGFVVFAFRFQDAILQKLQLKNKYTVVLSRIGKHSKSRIDNKKK